MFLFCLVFAMFCARLFICALWSPAGKGLTSWLSFVVSSVSLSLSHWYPGSGVVLDCIDSWSLQPYYLDWICFRDNATQEISICIIQHIILLNPVRLGSLCIVCASSKVVLHLKWSWHLFWSQIASQLVPAGIYYGTLSRL